MVKSGLSPDTWRRREMTDYEDIIEKIGEASVARKDSVDAGAFLSHVGDLAHATFEVASPLDTCDYVGAVIAKYTLQWAIKNVLFEQSSKNAIQEAIDELDKAWDARNA